MDEVTETMVLVECEQEDSERPTDIVSGVVSLGPNTKINMIVLAILSFISRIIVTCSIF